MSQIIDAAVKENVELISPSCLEHLRRRGNAIVIIVSGGDGEGVRSELLTAPEAITAWIEAHAPVVMTGETPTRWTHHDTEHATIDYRGAYGTRDWHEVKIISTSLGEWSEEK